MRSIIIYISAVLSCFLSLPAGSTEEKSADVIKSAQFPSGGRFAIRKSTIDAGGMKTSSAETSINATIGQWDIGNSQSETYQVSGGFWVRFSSSDFLFSDSFER